MREAPMDRISNLPDSLLHLILSFLHIRHGARTSVLSKRWNCIWTTVPTLHFQKHPHYPYSKTQEFMDFVDGTLHRHNSSNIEKFILCWYGPLNESRVHSWISTVVRGNVKELGLYLNKPQQWVFPLSLFTCESLISLELRALPSIRLPKYIFFPRLRRLKLVQYMFSDECWNEELFSNSPVLKELILEFCSVSMKFFCISIPTLKLLKIDHLIGEGTGTGLEYCVLKINAPKLVTLSYSGAIAKEFVLSCFPTLAEATINFFFVSEETSRLLQALAHVKCLSIYDQTLQAICPVYKLPNSLLTFCNVKILTISDHLTAGTDQGLISLLKGVPNLESLIFDEYMNDEIEAYEYSDEEGSDDAEDKREDDNEDNDADSVEDENNLDSEDEGDVADAAECEDNYDNEYDDTDSAESENNQDSEAESDVSDAAERGSNDECEDNYDNEDNSWAPETVTTGCLFPHLKSVCFQQFVRNPREMKWVRLILRDAKALQIMTIRNHESSECFANTRSEDEVRVEIPCFPRASPDCVIKYYSSHYVVVDNKIEDLLSCELL